MANVRNIAAPNYPTAPQEYNQKYQDQFTNILRLFSNGVSNAINAPKVHGSYYDTTQQTNGGATTVNLMKLNSTVSAVGTKIGSPTSRVFVAETGIYNLQFSAQLDKTGGGAAAEIFIWLRVNGADVPYSASKVVVQGANTELIAAWNFVQVLKANDYFEIAWSSTDTTAIIAVAPATAGPPAIPAIPSVILTVSWVSNIAI